MTAGPAAQRSEVAAKSSSWEGVELARSQCGLLIKPVPQTFVEPSSYEARVLSYKLLRSSAEWVPSFLPGRVFQK